MPELDGSLANPPVTVSPGNLLYNHPLFTFRSICRAFLAIVHESQPIIDNQSVCDILGRQYSFYLSERSHW